MIVTEKTWSYIEINIKYSDQYLSNIFPTKSFIKLAFTEKNFDIPLEASFFSPSIQLGNASAWKIIWKHELPGGNKKIHPQHNNKKQPVKYQNWGIAKGIQ